jgi:hypothetical protein
MDGAAMSVHTGLIFKLLVLTACAMAASSVAKAVDNTRYISINGNNANACTLAAPCLTLQRGIDATPAGGELRILDSGFYGSDATVSKSMTITGNGNTVFLDASIVINDADAAVTLRDLTLNGQGANFEGIDIIAAAAVHIEQCTIHGYSRYGISAVADEVQVFVRDSIMRDNRLGGITVGSGASLLMIDESYFANNGRDGTDDAGIAIGSGHATISRSAASGNPTGIHVYGTASVSIVSTAVVQNDTNGAVATGTFPNSNCTLTVESSLVHGAGVNGLLAVSGCIVRISNSTFTGNGRGIQNSGAVVETRQNNTVRGNGTDLSGGNPLTPFGGI